MVELSLESLKSLAFEYQHIDLVIVAEWLRRWTWNPLGFPHAGSNPADCDNTVLIMRFWCCTEKGFFQYLAIIKFQRVKIPYNGLQQYLKQDIAAGCSKTIWSFSLIWVENEKWNKHNVSKTPYFFKSWKPISSQEVRWIQNITSITGLPILNVFSSDWWQLHVFFKITL